MKTIIKLAVLATAALSVTAAPMTASAQSWHGGDRDYDGRYDRGGDHGRYDNDRYDGGRHNDWRHDRGRHNGYGHYQRDRYENRGYYRGGTLPYQYRSNWYIRDYNRYGYAPPPRGYGYYRTDTGDIVVAALATGVILSLLNNR